MMASPLPDSNAWSNADLPSALRFFVETATNQAQQRAGSTDSAAVVSTVSVARPP